jgi:uncharacterized membrane protein (UPF0136 family)
MVSIIKVFYIAFGLLTIAGGIIGYAAKKSVPSIVAGSILGVALLAGAFLVSVRFNVGLSLGLIASTALAGKFIPDFLTKKAFFPAGLMAILSVVSIALTILAWYRF